MKKFFLLLNLALSGVTLSVKAQHCKGDFLGTKTLYEAPSPEQGNIPPGYQPVFINYVGRHGARHLTKPPESADIYKLINQADSERLLTKNGEMLKQMLANLQKVEKGNVKNISAEGKAELQGIAARMYHENTRVFAEQPHIQVSYSKEVRTKQSAEAFVSGLPKPLGADVEQQGINDTALRFYDLSPAYLNFEQAGSWMPQLAALKAQLKLNEINHAITARLFKADFLSRMNNEVQENFVSDLFGFATITHSLKAEIQNAGYQPADLDFELFFTCTELEKLAKIDAAEDFLKKGPGTDAMGIQVKIAVPLLVDFVKSTDDFLKQGKISARLRFGHAETISPFATLMNLSIANSITNHISQFDRNWKVNQVIPLSANIQWILYKNTKGNLLVKVLLNEKPALITGLKTHYRFYYNWEDMRNFYLNRLRQAGASLNAHMSSYLQTVL
ncbi:histidine-type phosphatase [Mucilaginibacter koreensis]